ncbi:MAG: hypothetical protein Q8T03_01165 [Bacteroidota bacterium]|nr:hypothetical protein [Bacteroidota bacterium]
MSSHFNYEIDERNMRNQLKDLEVSFKEEAWQNYEAYAKQFQSVHKTQLLPNFNFALNRTVIMPLVFGGIIILFSILLFNFINIKNSSPKKSEVSDIKPTVTSNEVKNQEPAPKKQIIVPVIKEENIKSEPQAVITKTITQSLPTSNSVEATAKTIPATTMSVATEPVMVNNVGQDTQSIKSAVTYTFEPKKKKKKKNRAEVMESIATPMNLPALTQEAEEPELK